MAAQSAPMRSMINILLVSLLIVAQLAAPLVHAHVGGGSAPGSLHVPGLEMLAAPPNQASAQPAMPPLEQPGMVVGIATGLQFEQSGYLIPPPAGLMAAQLFPGMAAKPLRTPPPAASIPPPFPTPPRLTQAAPRAPPRTTSII